LGSGSCDSTASAADVITVGLSKDAVIARHVSCVIGVWYDDVTYQRQTVFAE